MFARMKDQRSVSTDADSGQERKASIKRPRSLSSKIAGLFAVAVALLFIATAFSPLTSAEDIDLVAKDASLMGVKIDVLKLDTKDIMNKAASGEPLSLRVNDSSVSFTLKEGTLLADNFRVMLPDGTSLGRSDGIPIPRFFSGASPEGVTVSLTVVGEWMRFSVQTNDSSYSIDAYDGTGASGYYAAYRSGPSPASAADVVDDKEPTVRESMYRVAEPLDTTTASSASEATAPTSSEPQDQKEFLSSDMGQEMSASDMSLMSSYSNEYSSVLVDIFLAADHKYVSDHSGDWSYRIYSELWNVHAQYESQAGVSFRAVGLGQLDANTCTSFDAYTLWTQFKSYLNGRTTYPTSSDWDVAHLFSGKTLNPGNGNYCTYSSGAGIAILRNDPATFESYGCSISQQTYTGSNENEWLLGHCIGLSLNADHAYAGSSTDWMWSTYNQYSTMSLNANDVNRIQTFAQQVCDRSKLINFGGSEHWNNLYVTNMVMITTDVPTVGNSVTFGFTVYNTGNAITLPVLCVGGRDAYGNVKDFGQRYNVQIPGKANGIDGAYDFWNTSSTGFDSGGTWTIFASAYYNGQYSPYEWLALHPTVYYCLKLWHRINTPSDFTTNDLLHHWGIYSTSPFVGPGSEIMVSFTLFSKAGGTGYTNYNWIFVEARDPNDACKDFGGVSNPVLTNGGHNGILGGGLHEKVTTTLNGPSGVWKIGPCYKIAGQDWGPWMAPLYIDVGVVILHWGSSYDQYNNGLIYNQNIGTEVTIELPTYDGGGATVSIGFRVINFQTVLQPDTVPGVQIELTHIYLDKKNTLANGQEDVNAHNGMISIKLNIDRLDHVIMGINGGDYGNYSAYIDSNAQLFENSAGAKWNGGTHCAYPSQLNEPPQSMDGGQLAYDIVTTLLTGMVPELGLPIALVDITADIVEMVGSIKNTDYYSQTIGDTSPAYAIWTTTDNIEYEVPPLADMTASFNKMNLYTRHTNDEYVFCISGSLTYANRTTYSSGIEAYITSEVNVVQIPEIYLIVV